jgi:hypothetical protein
MRLKLLEREAVITSTIWNAIVDAFEGAVFGFESAVTAKCKFGQLEVKIQFVQPNAKRGVYQEDPLNGITQ